MSAMGKSIRLRLGLDASGRPPPPTATAPSALPVLASLTDPLLQKRYRELTHKHLGGLAGRLFAEFTGLHFHIAWAPSVPHDWTAMALPAGCAMCRPSAGTWVEARACCQSCGREHLARALRTDGDGHRFTCRLGVRNCWFPIRLRGVPVGIAYVQALAGPGLTRHDGAQRNGPGRRSQRGAGEARHLSRAAFCRAAKLLRFIVQHVQTSSLAELRQADLARARQALLDFETVQQRLRQELLRLTPLFGQSAVQPAPEGRAERTLHWLLEFIHEHYAQPLTLRSCADTLRLNAAYLSALFSHRVGMPFKAYLTEARMEKAKELLSDPTRNVSEAASAVGYASENRFRAAFKKATGLPPRIWRETLRLANVVVLIWALGEEEFVEGLEMLFPF